MGLGTCGLRSGMGLGGAMVQVNIMDTVLAHVASGCYFVQVWVLIFVLVVGGRAKVNVSSMHFSR